MNESKSDTWGALTDNQPDDLNKHRMNAAMVALLIDEAIEAELDQEEEMTNVDTTERE